MGSKNAIAILMSAFGLAWKLIKLPRLWMFHRRMKDRPAVKGANMNSHSAFLCPKVLQQQSIEVCLPWSSLEVNTRHTGWDSCFHSCFSSSGCVMQGGTLSSPSFSILQFWNVKWPCIVLGSVCSGRIWWSVIWDGVCAYACY